MKKLKVSIIGAGFGQEVHVPAFRHLAGCEVTAVACSNQPKAAAVAGKLGIARAYGSWRELLDREEIDILAIATPPGLQYEIAKAALQKSIAVFCEKPLALTSGQSLELVTLAAGNGVPQMVDFEFTEIPAWRECRDRIRLGHFGALERIDVVWSVQTFANRHRTTSWKTDAAQGGGPLFGFASHALYYLPWFAGPIVSLRCHCAPSPLDPRGVDTLVLLDARFRSGTTAGVRIATNDAFRREHSLSFKAGEGALRLENTGGDYIQGFQLYARRFGDDGFSEIPPSSGWDVDFGGNRDGRVLAVGSLASRLVQWVRGGPGAQPDFTAGHQVQRLLSLALHSNLNGGAWKDLDPA